MFFSGDCPVHVHPHAPLRGGQKIREVPRAAGLSLFFLSPVDLRNSPPPLMGRVCFVIIPDIGDISRRDVGFARLLAYFVSCLVGPTLKEVGIE